MMNWFWEEDTLFNERPCALPGAYAEVLAEAIENWLAVTGEEQDDDLRRS